MRKFFPLIVFSLVLVAVSSLIGYSLGMAEKSKRETNQVIETPIQDTAEENSDEGVKTYTNEEYGFTFDYPADFELWEEQTSMRTYINMNGLYELLTLEVSEQETESFYSSQPISRVDTFNGIDWSYHEPSEYCDAGECNDTVPGYTTRKNNLLFTLTISAPNSDPATATKIISTFRFL